MLGKMWKNWITPILEVGEKNSTAILEDSLSLSEIKHATTVQPALACLDIYSREMETRFT